MKQLNYADVLTRYHYLLSMRLAHGRMDDDKFDRCVTTLTTWEYQWRELPEVTG